MSLGTHTALKDMTDEALYTLWSGKQDAAFTELYSRYSKKLLFYFVQMFHGDSDKAQDFLHDLFFKIIEKPERFNPEKRFSTWVYTVAANMCKNEYRDLAVRKLVGNNFDLSRVEHKAPQADILVDRKLFKSSLAKALNTLSKEHRNVYLLRFHMGLPLKAIAEIMECSEGTVKSRLFYTLKKLGTQLHSFNPKKAAENE